MQTRFFQLMKLFLAVSTFVMQTAIAQQYQTDTFLNNQMQQYHIPAVSVAIIDNGEVKMIKAYGKANLEYNIPNTIGTSFQLASATKLIAATAIMTLAQEGRLKLDAPVKNYLPELPVAWSDLRVMDLVAHQSGVADLLAMKYNFNNAKQALDTALSKPLDFVPGTKTVYAGGDYALVMSLLERISGKPFQQFIKEALFDKLGMQHSLYNNMEQDYIYRTLDTIPFAATVYKWDAQKPQQRIFSMMFPSWTYPSGGLFSSIEDLAKWAVALDRQTLLDHVNEEKMWTAAKHRDGSTAPFGVGWIVDQHNGEKATGHSGGPALADIVRLPGKNITVIVLTNQLELRPFLAMKVLDLYLLHRK